MRVFAKLEIDSNLDSVTAAQGIRNQFPKVAAIFYPDFEQKGKGTYGFDFVRLSPILDWASIHSWCDTRSDRFLPDDTVLIMVTGHPFAGSTRQLSEWAPLFLEHKLPIRWDINFRSMKGDGAFEVTLEVLGGKALCNLILQTPKRASNPEDVQEIRSFWEQALRTFDCLAEWKLHELLDESNTTTFQLASPAKQPASPGILSQFIFENSQVSPLLTAFWTWISELGAQLRFFQESVNLYPNGQLVVPVSKYCFEKMARASIAFNGTYHRNFRFEQVVHVVPLEGYWEFPLFQFKLGSSVVPVYMIQTLDQRFVEFQLFGEDSEKKLLAYFKKNNIPWTVEFWKGPASERWGLDKLSRAN